MRLAPPMILGSHAFPCVPLCPLWWSNFGPHPRTKAERCLPNLEYHIPVRHPRPASVALLSLLGLSLSLAPNSHAQANGTPTSVTSQGFGGPHPITAPFPIGGTLPGHQVPNPGSRVTFSTSIPTPNPGHGDGHHHHHSGDRPVLYAFPVPYAVDLAPTEDQPEDQAEDNSAADHDRDPNYQGGPTIFDRRGSGADSYIPPARSTPAHRSAEHRSPEYVQPDPPTPDPNREPTVLVFKDGHQLEVGNYAIVGTTLFDLTPGHSRKVPLADLDLDATQLQNDDRGITFQIPQLPQAN